MTRFFEFLVYALARAAIFPFQIGSLRWARSLGSGLGLFAYYVLPIRKAVIRKNLEAYFGREWDEARLRRGVRDAYKNFGMAVGEFAFGERLRHENVEQFVQMEGLEHYAAAHGSGRPVIMYGSHQTMWELSMTILHWCREPFIVVMKRIHNHYLNAYLTRRREIFGAEMISQRGAIAVLESQTSAKNINFAFFVDQRAAKGKGVWIDIRGNAVSAMAGPAVLAVRFGLPILPVQMLRTKTGLIIRYHPLIDYKLTGDERADVQRVTQCINDRVTDWVTERPGEYFWFHNRFKIHPAETQAAADFLAAQRLRVP